MRKFGRRTKQSDLPAADQPSNDPHTDGERALWNEQRRYRRVTLKIAVRFMLDDGSENIGKVLDISAGGIAIQSATVTRIGDRVIMYIDELGRFEGKVVRHVAGGFAVEFQCGEFKKEKTANTLTWLMNHTGENEEDDDERRHRRVALGKQTCLQLPDGKELKCQVTDMSEGGLAIEISLRPAIGEIITIGSMEGRVVRHTSNGIGIEFTNIPRRDRKLTESLFS